MVERLQSYDFSTEHARLPPIKNHPPTSDRVAKPMPLQYGNMPQCFHAWMNASGHARGPPLAPDELWCAKPSTNYSLRWFRGSCHELSCQLSRTIVPVATNYRANCHVSLQNAGTTFIFRWVMVSSDENGEGIWRHWRLTQSWATGPCPIGSCAKVVPSHQTASR